ncbi:ferrochelatase [Fulvitalea axinellae]|uniref:Ferrochelatase n=1 Tax=Fulvitalea axinellae TaxID=1182444 RepID=A0AAU9D0M1_9BACT|nr:ferrochelatase [Fulvitalea axinellae]
MAKSNIKKGVLVVNLGTPDSPKTPDVRKYLREFLMDGRVIDIPFLSRWALVNLIIAPFRAPKSAKTYAELWEDRGSPLMFYGEDVVNALKNDSELSGYEFALAMRYQSPSIESGLEYLRSKNVSEIIVLPLFPQYASATTGSVVEKVNSIIKKWQVIPSIRFVNQFYDKELFVKAWASVASSHINKKEYDHYVFSYHGLPERQIRKASVDGYCKLSEKCCSNINKKNQYCYRAQCFATTRLLAEAMGIPEEKYTICFQSRLGKEPWIQPYAEDVIESLAKSGQKKVLAFSPAFVADCLETTIEVGDEFKEEFEHAGGEVWDLVPSLNAHPDWVECLKQIILEKS